MNKANVTVNGKIMILSPKFVTIKVTNPNSTNYHIKIFTDTSKLKIDDSIYVEGKVAWDSSDPNGIAIRAKKVMKVNDL